MLGIPPELRFGRDLHVNPPFAFTSMPIFKVLLKADISGKEAPHLVLKAAIIATRSAARGIEAEFTYEAGEGVRKLEATLARTNGFGVHPEEQQTRQTAVGKSDRAILSIVPPRAYPEREVAIRASPGRGG